MTKKSKTASHSLDPHYQRESEKYKEPIPSREWIIQVLEEYGRPMSRSRLTDTLQITEEPRKEALSFRLRAMLRDGQLMLDRRNRYCLLKKINLRPGTVHAHPDGYGFFIPDDEGDDMLLSAREMRNVMHGDKVLGYPIGVDRRGRSEGKIHEVLEHVNQTVVGRYICEHGVNFVIPDSKHLTQDISIAPEHISGAQSGQIVLVEMLAYPDKQMQAIGKIIHVLGDHMAPGMEIEVAILAHGIPDKWPEAVIKEVSAIRQQVSAADLVQRTDLRHLPFVTIDGEDAKDFDDAVFCQKKNNGNYQLYVAIADVGHYVPPESALDKEAAMRGNSVYFPGKVVPMLPEALSNGVCSLKPKVDRLCMVAEMSINPQGKINRSRFYKAVIHSQARLTYTMVNDWLVQQQCPAEYGQLWPHIQVLHALYAILCHTRKARGAMDFDSTETRIEFDDNRKIQRIVPVVRNDAHRLIEECMLAANVATARFLEKAGVPSLYRVHAAPEEEKVLALREFLQEMGYALGGGKKPSPKDFQYTLQTVADKPEKHLIETVMLRSLKQAKYVEVNAGHFGLAYPAYTHFTSPIRRYPDLLIHRAICIALSHATFDDGVYTDEEMGRFGKHCSMTERRADEATREVVAWLKCEYMQSKLGQVFSGRIATVTSFGLFVQLDEIYVEGLVHVTSLQNDYYTFDAVKHRLIGARSGQDYRIGDRMTVLVARVDLDERKIDFEPVLDEPAV